jgi:hypothetical protein
LSDGLKSQVVPVDKTDSSDVIGRRRMIMKIRFECQMAAARTVPGIDSVVAEEVVSGRVGQAAECWHVCIGRTYAVARLICVNAR